MKTSKTSSKTRSTGLTRREMLKYSGLALGGLAVSGGATKALAANTVIPRTAVPTLSLETPPAAGQMRMTFCGTWYTPRPNQACNSIFVELGNGQNGAMGDSFVFDCGAGVVAKYVALGVPYSRMDKIFLTHLHGDHMSDLTTIYCFGPSADRKSPLHVWGPSGDTKNEGTWFFCQKLLEMTKWHRESFSFLQTGYADDGDGYDLVAHELRYMKNPGLAYDSNGVKISHFPAIHARDGSISYKFEWNGRSMVFSGDTKPNTYMLENAQGVDVLVHEMTATPGIWTTKTTGLTPDGPYPEAYWRITRLNTQVIENSHTMWTAFGYILSKTKPKLGVATHFPNDPDLIQPAINAIQCHYDGEYGRDYVIANDLLVITIDPDGTISQATAVVPDYPWYAGAPLKGPLAPSKYDGPLAQFNNELLDHIIPLAEYECKK